jgi:hypothetical protein
MLAATALLLAAYGWTANWLSKQPRKAPEEDLALVIPGPVQLVMAGGDRYLAANLTTLNALVKRVEALPPDAQRNLAEAQRVAARLNGAQEDNYYIAAATLPWIGGLEATNEILERAHAARPWDAMPAFFLGFNYQQFVRDYRQAGAWYQQASQRSAPGNREILAALAARVFEKGADTQLALNFIDGLIASARDPRLKQFLLARRYRVETLAQLRALWPAFNAREGRPPRTLEELARGLSDPERRSLVPQLSLELDADGYPQLTGMPKPPGTPAS